MMRKIKKLKLRRKIWDMIKQNKLLTFASTLFIIFSGINIMLIYSFVQVLGTI